MRKWKELTKEQKRLALEISCASGLYLIGVLSGINLSNRKIREAISIVEERNERAINSQGFGIGFQQGKNYIIETAINKGELGSVYNASDGSSVRIIAKDYVNKTE